MKLNKKLLFAGILLYSFNFANAGSVTANMMVNVTLAPSCIINVKNINIHEISPNANGGYHINNNTVSITCTKNTSYTVKRNSSGYLNTKNDNNDKLEYLVYNDNDELWQNNSVGINSQGNGAEKLHDIRIKVPLNRYVKADTYSDNMILVIDY